MHVTGDQGQSGSLTAEDKSFGVKRLVNTFGHPLAAVAGQRVPHRWRDLSDGKANLQVRVGDGKCKDAGVKDEDG